MTAVTERQQRAYIGAVAAEARDRKSTRLNSSHLVISYAVFCLKKKKKNNNDNVFTLPPLGEAGVNRDPVINFYTERVHVTKPETSDHPTIHLPLTQDLHSHYLT